MRHAGYSEEWPMRGGSLEDAAVEHVRAVLARLVGVDPASLTRDTVLGGYDIDSIIAAELVVTTQSALDIDIDVAGIPQDWSELTLGELAECLATSTTPPRHGADRR